jgi:putative ABC transport system permease protein
MISDLKFALRSLRYTPGFTLVAVLIVAIGIGAATAMFSAVNALVLRPLALPEPDRLVSIYETNLPRNQPFFSVSVPNFADWKARARSWESLAATSGRAMNLTSDGEPELVQASTVTASFFPTLGMPVLRGRNFLEAEDAPGGAPVAILSEAFWQRRFGGAADILGRTLTLDGTPYTVVGVLGPDQPLPTPIEIAIPMAADPAKEGRMNHELSAVGRLKPGVSLEQADTELKDIAAQIWIEHPEMDRGWSTRLLPFSREIVGDSVREGLFVLLGAVGLLLLIACANLSNLLLVRASARAYELAIRTSLGARRGQVIRQIVTEGLVVTLLGGTAGVLVALWAVDLMRLLPLPRAAQISVDLRVLGVACMITLVAGLLAGLPPALKASVVHPQEALKGRAPRSSQRSSLRDAMVVAQLAISLTLLVGVALLARSFWQLLRVDPGFRTDDVLAVSLRPAANAIPFYERLTERIKALPGVSDAGLISALPLTRGNTSLNVFPDGPSVIPSGQSIQANWRLVDGGYFGAMRIPVLRGQTFAGLDPEEAGRSVVISNALARSLWGDEDPVGRQLDPGGNRRFLRVIGVVGDVRARSLGAEPSPTFYWSMYRFLYGPMHLVVHSAGEKGALLSGVRAAVKEIDPTVPVFRVRTLDELRAQSLEQERLILSLLGGFTAVALVLAALGTYGVMAFTVQQRTREIGLRIAVGAQPADILRIVVGQGGRLVSVGIALGLLGAFASARVLGAMLYETATTDPLSYLAATAALALAALGAAVLPARRASRVDPMVALRSE